MKNSIEKVVRNMIQMNRFETSQTITNRMIARARSKQAHDAI